MPEEEKEDIHKIISEGVAKAMVTVYWMIGGTMLTMLIIFVSIAWPLTQTVIDLKVKVETFVTTEKAFSTFMTKIQYHQLQKDEHGIDIQAVKHPEQSDYLYMEHNINEAERLEIRYRGGTQ